MILIMSSELKNLFDGCPVFFCEKDKVLFRSGERVRSMYLVVEGRVDLIRHTTSGARLVLVRAGPGHILAEASAYSKTYHCDAVATYPTSLRSISVRKFHDLLNRDSRCASAWAESMAHALQGARTNSEIRTLRTVSERLDAWLGDRGPLPPKGEWQDLAQTLGVTREALYRELSKRRG